MGWQYRTARRCARLVRSFRSNLWPASLAIASASVMLACAPADGATTATTTRTNSSTGAPVGVFELGAPEIDRFVLHGTLPIPAGIFPMRTGQSPFMVRDPEGNITPAQTEIVTRYANEEDGADVVEILSEVRRPERAATGDRLRYEVLYAPHAEMPFQTDADVDALLKTPDMVTMTSSDVFGNAYTADLTTDWCTAGPSLRILKRGLAAVQFATHQSLAPERHLDGPEGTLPHLMGVHAYVTQWRDEPVFSLDLRIHNAHSGNDKNDPMNTALGKIYFKSLELRLPAGWKVFNSFPDPYWGQPYVDGDRTAWPVVGPLAGGKLHEMPQMSQFHRRLVVCKVGYENRADAYLREQGLGFCREGEPTPGQRCWSWWNPTTGRYFPQRHRLPSLDQIDKATFRANDQAQLGLRADQVATGAPGQWPAECPGLGWAQPWGINDGAMVGGLEIYLWEGVRTAVAASTDGYRLTQLIHRMLSDRQPNVLFDSDGRPTRMEEWIIHGPTLDTLPIWWYGGPMLWASDPFGITTSPSFQRDAVTRLGLGPDYEYVLDHYEIIDQAHLIRYTRMAKVLAWLGNDAIAKDDIRAQAEGIRLAYNMYRQNSWPQGVISTGMLNRRTYVNQYPGWGFPYGRGDGWGLDIVSASYSLGDPEWRRLVRPWFDLVVDLVRDGQADCTGIIQSTFMGNIFNAQYRNRQSIECAIVEHALVGMRESVFHGVSQERVAETDDILQKDIYAMISPLVWDHTIRGPWAMIAVGLADATTPPFCTYWPPDGNYMIPDHFQIWSSFAYAYEITHDVTFLNYAAEGLGGGGPGAGIRELIHQYADYNIECMAALDALVEKL
jgi:hypothetical protein